MSSNINTSVELDAPPSSSVAGSTFEERLCNDVGNELLLSANRIAELVATSSATSAAGPNDPISRATELVVTSSATSAAGPNDPISRAMIDSSNYVKQEEWFQLLQDDGIPLSTEELEQWKNKPTKRKSSHITSSGRHYKQLYGLASKVYDVYYAKNVYLFVNMLKNKSDCIHLIGKEIAKTRHSRPKADIHSLVVGEEFKQFVSQPEFNGRAIFHFVPQGQILKFFLEKWTGSTTEELMKPTDSDKLRVTGILFQEGMREFIPYLLKNGDKSKRLTLDEWNGKKRRAFVLFTQHFCDPDVKISLPSKWFEEITKTKINEKVGENAWEDLTEQFDPNKPHRISLPRTEEHMKIIVGNVIREYNTVMEDYTKNTGGGDGDEALYVVWQEREDAAIVNYDRKIKGGVYLTIVHMWNKQFNFPLVTTKDPIPDACQVDDNSGDNISNLQSPSLSGHSNKVPSNRQENKVLTAQRVKLTDVMDKLLVEMQQSNPDVVDRQHDVIGMINTTNDSLQKFGEKLTELHAKKKRLHGGNDEQKKSKKMKTIERDIKQAKTMIKTMKKTLQQQQEALEKVNGGGDGSDDGDSSSDSDDSDSQE